ncbi:MAG: FecR domain-containing protein [Chitinophagaceae bacterium]|nr:FecR domain-containing protein [Chitinophagaceae bacterium]MCW5929056.1 FecR domain-containing protein [Chitinophagaceae bacterium]
MIPNRIWQLVARKLSGEAGIDEIRELETLLKEDAELAYRVHLYTRYFENPSGGPAENSRQEAGQRFRERLSREKTEKVTPVADLKNKTPMRGKWLVAAGWVLLAVLSVFLYRLNSREDKGNPVTLANEFKTMPGTRSKTTLPDGSVVWLNSESRITYNKDFGVNNREVALQGEAFFDVVKNKAVPFIVHAQTVKIVVKGTAFNVRSYPGSQKVQTSLIRGAVELINEADPEHPIQLKPNEKITIRTGKRQLAEVPEKPGQKTETYHLDTLRQLAQTMTIPEVSWVVNQLVFDNEVFTEVIDKMEKWYNVDIVLINDALGSKQFSAVYEDEDVVQALEALQYVHHFDFEVKGRTIVIK